MKNSYGTLMIVLAAFVLLWGCGCKRDQQAEQQSGVPEEALAAGGKVDDAVSGAASDVDGRSLFQMHCAVCHPGGGNIINPQKTLDGQALSANGIETVGDIVANMRQPGPGMTRFDENLLSDRQAARIAEYILQTY